MKIGKYPVKHRYQIARLVSDVLSIGLAVVIVSTTIYFLQSYNEMLSQMGVNGVAEISSEYISGFEWRQWLALIFPVLVAALFAAYIVLTLKSHPFKKYNVTKLTAQSCCDVYTFCVSLCKIPILMGIFDVMYIFHQNMLGAEEKPFSIQILLDIVIIAIIIRLGMHRIDHITAPKENAAEAGQTAEAAKIRVRINPINDNSDGQEENK